jgi:hypothetical protein
VLSVSVCGVLPEVVVVLIVIVEEVCPAGTVTALGAAEIENGPVVLVAAGPPNAASPHGVPLPVGPS